MTNYGDIDIVWKVCIWGNCVPIPDDLVDDIKKLVITAYEEVTDKGVLAMIQKNFPNMPKCQPEIGLTVGEASPFFDLYIELNNMRLNLCAGETKRVIVYHGWLNNLEEFEKLIQNYHITMQAAPKSARKC